MIAAANADNFTAAWNGTVPTGPGTWFSSIGKPPLLPMLGEMRPFFMTSGHQFRAAPDAPLGFLCMVNAERDRPQLPTADELAGLTSVPAIAAFLRE